MAYHFQKTSSAVMVLLVDLEVLVERVDSGSKKSDLYFGRTGVTFVGCKIFDDLLFFVFKHCHGFFTFRFLPQTQQAAGEGLTDDQLYPQTVFRAVFDKNYHSLVLYNKNIRL